MVVHPEILPGVRCESYKQWFARVWNSGPQNANREELFTLYQYWFKMAGMNMECPFNFACKTTDPNSFNRLVQMIYETCGPTAKCRGFITYGSTPFAFYQQDTAVPTLKQMEKWFKIG